MKFWVLTAAVLMSLPLCSAIDKPGDKVYVNFQEVMIPMRDGARLQTVIISPKDAKTPLPIILQRTPYGVPAQKDVENGLPAAQRSQLEHYIFAIQNLRGRFKSEGKWVMQRPPHAADDPNGVDETTDAWDTVEWLVHHVPGNNGRAGIRGTSYDAWTAVMAALNPHPAVKAIIEQASPADMFLGDDFHHNGAFRLSYGFEYSALLETNPEENYHFKFDRADTYEWYLNLGALRNADERFFHGKIPTWEDFVQHPNDDEFWHRQTLITYINEVKVPILHVAGWWDQEDFYGPQTLYEAMEKFDRKGGNYFVAGPWNHGQWQRDGSRLGPLSFGSDTSRYYRENIAERWFDYWLRGEGKLDLPEATVFETGTNRWRQYTSWPPRETHTQKLFLQSVRKLTSNAPTTQAIAYDEYISDPANPVPYRPRPVAPTYPGPEWPVWLVQDQRFVDHRPDVLSYETEPLTSDLRVVGDIVADLFASTSGTDSDWAVKVIDVCPEDAAPDAETGTKMGGYQLIVADEIFRGRFLHSFEHPEALPPNEPVRYRIDLHTNDHVFLKGHRVMVQIQSSWFPVYDRNPQKFMANIFDASDSDYEKAVQRVYHTPAQPSAVILPVLDSE